MRGEEELEDYYKLLGVNPEASGQVLDDAYQRAIKMYTSSSVALYSLYSKEEREEKLKALEKAYHTLKDPEKKQLYDENRVLPKGVGKRGQVVDFNELKEEVKSHREQAKTSRRDYLKILSPLAVMDELSPIGDQYRILYTRIEDLSKQKPYKVLAFTSSLMGEGKTTSSLNFSYMLARDFNKKTLLVECDLKRPSILTYFERHKARKGLVDVVTGSADIEDALYKIDEEKFFILPTLGPVKNSAEILGSPALAALLNSLKSEFDYIVLDCPPVLSLADTNIIARFVDGILFVVRAAQTPKHVVVKAVNSLDSSSVIGIVLNGIEMMFNKYYQSYYRQ